MCHSAGRAAQKTKTRKVDSELVAEKTKRKKQGNNSRSGQGRAGRYLLLLPNKANRTTQTEATGFSVSSFSEG